MSHRRKRGRNIRPHHNEDATAGTRRRMGTAERARERDAAEVWYIIWQVHTQILAQLAVLRAINMRLIDEEDMGCVCSSKGPKVMPVRTQVASIDE